MKILNVADKIKAVLINYDLEIESAKAQLKKAYAKSSCFKDSKIHWQQDRYYSGKIEIVKYQTYIEQLRKCKKELIEDLEKVLDVYYPLHKRIWLMYCLESAKPKEISKALNIHYKTVMRIIKIINQDFINYGILEKEGENNDSTV